jgi:catechol 2,3-dioxygenase-like lactoylglutathione lyase family enzyme
MDNFKTPKIAYDGGVVDTLWDYHESAVDWYEKNLSLVPHLRADKNHRFDDNTHSELRSLFSQIFGLHSVITSKRLVHLFAERATVDADIRLCLQTKRLEQERAYLKENNIRVSDVYTGPGEKSYFDFWATAEGIRFSVVAALELPDDAPRYSSAFIRIGVSDLKSSVQWYEKFMGFTRTEGISNLKWVEMHTPHIKEVKFGENIDDRVTYMDENYSVFIEELPKGSNNGRVDGPVRIYFHIDDREIFKNYHQMLKDNGVTVSPIQVGFEMFHIYDPDGNRLNFWLY